MTLCKRDRRPIDWFLWENCTSLRKWRDRKSYSILKCSFNWGNDFWTQVDLASTPGHENNRIKNGKSARFRNVFFVYNHGIVNESLRLDFNFTIVLFSEITNIVVKAGLRILIYNQGGKNLRFSSECSFFMYIVMAVFPSSYRSKPRVRRSSGVRSASLAFSSARAAA